MSNSSLNVRAAAVIGALAAIGIVVVTLLSLRRKSASSTGDKLIVENDIDPATGRKRIKLHSSRPMANRRYGSYETKRGDVPLRTPLGATMPQPVIKFVNDVYAIDGTDAVELEPYTLTVYVARATNHETIVQSILPVVSTYVGDGFSPTVERVTTKTGSK